MKFIATLLSSIVLLLNVSVPAAAAEYSVTNDQVGDSAIAWRVFEKDDDPHVQDSDEITVPGGFVPADQYVPGITRLSLVDGKEYCLRVFKGEGSEFGTDRWGNNRIRLTTSSVTVFDWFVGDGQHVDCFTAYDQPITRNMCIYSSKAEGPDGSFAGENVLDPSFGHAAIALVYENSHSDGDPWIKTYGKWPSWSYYDILEDDCRDWPGNSEYKYFYCREITYQQWLDAESFVASQSWMDSDWTPTNNCASFASEIFLAITGVDVDADDAGFFGSETPHELGKSIIQLNGGYGSLPVEVGSRNCRRFLRG